MVQIGTPSEQSVGSQQAHRVGKGLKAQEAQEVGLNVLYSRNSDAFGMLK